MNHKFLRYMEKLAKIEAKLRENPQCGTCHSRTCMKPNRCDPYAKIENAIVACATLGAFMTLEECLASDTETFRGMTRDQIALAYKAGELLASKS